MCTRQAARAEFGRSDRRHRSRASDWAPSGAFGRGSANHHYDGAQRRVIGIVTRPYVGAMTTIAICGPAWTDQLSRR
jgi:hypothetical protein